MFIRFLGGDVKEIGKCMSLEFRGENTVGKIDF